MLRSPLGRRVGAVAKPTSVVTLKLLWEKVGFMGLIAVPGMSILAEMCHLIKYSPHNNSQTETFMQNPNALGSFQCSIK